MTKWSLFQGCKGGLIIFKNQSMLSHILTEEPHDNKNCYKNHLTKYPFMIEPLRKIAIGKIILNLIKNTHKIYS